MFASAAGIQAHVQGGLRSRFLLPLPKAIASVGQAGWAGLLEQDTHADCFGGSAGFSPASRLTSVKRAPSDGV